MSENHPWMKWVLIWALLLLPIAVAGLDTGSSQTATTEPDLLLLFTLDGCIHAIEGQTGARRWTYNSTAPLVTTAQTVYTPSPGSSTPSQEKSVSNLLAKNFLNEIEPMFIPSPTDGYLFLYHKDRPTMVRLSCVALLHPLMAFFRNFLLQSETW